MGREASGQAETLAKFRIGFDSHTYPLRLDTKRKNDIMEGIAVGMLSSLENCGNSTPSVRVRVLPLTF